MLRPTDIYTTTHKYHRYALFTMAIHAGRTEYTNQESVDKLHGLLLTFRTQLKHHMWQEETLVHPLLAKRVPGAAREIEEEHRMHAQRMDDLILLMEEVIAKSKGFANIRELGLELYRALNRWISGYLVHINKEEETIMPTMWKVCTEDELTGIVNNIVADLRNQTQDYLDASLKVMLPAYDPEELGELFMRAEYTPPEDKKRFNELAEKSLTPEEIASDKKHMSTYTSTNQQGQWGTNKQWPKS